MLCCVDDIQTVHLSYFAAAAILWIGFAILFYVVDITEMLQVLSSSLTRLPRYTYSQYSYDCSKVQSAQQFVVLTVARRRDALARTSQSDCDCPDTYSLV